ncbi:hypothetical protein CC1G_03650 [Coprinopsis cinerea okayama7|uniref:Uncharacterized protein n=1 Tax=Coprinopsis cinerea (strain Okayama-7 / 130 / ATCC MYA-4618 / FGSC 9003) TaxID=240176 RepID=A8N1V7_COPC7|nr:hypothetical protein CC1G_03650 [Coprinopsis cinerea okayama7\|eukprot:XP_001828856.1 hypothetical protein CC1G_03650 [Coprinopsis cinerea okayama7\
MDHSIPPPPSYSQQDPAYEEPQIILVPTVDAVNFQKGYLGADGERAAIEGEIQVKGIDPKRWTRVTVSLRTYEMAYQHEIELTLTELELYSRRSGPLGTSSFPSTFPFSIPLMPDTPQSIQTPHSVLAHTLTASLHPVNPAEAPISKSLTVHTRRYTSSSSTIPTSPETYALDEPTRVEVQVPRTTFSSGEDIPLYITVPPPTRETVVDKGLRIRNIRAELVRAIKVRRQLDAESEGDSDVDRSVASDEASFTSNNTLAEPDDPSSSSKAPFSPLFLGSTSRTVIARSGASCRFHTSRPIQLRFILHQTPGNTTPSESRTSLAGTESNRLESDAESALITQLTLLHNVTFHIKVYISLVDTTNHSERISTITIPIVISPPPAPLPQVSQAIDEAYSKKHDRPPARTNRYEEDSTVPYYTVNEPGPSMYPGAPPPFDDREAPPPFFATELEASTSSRLPTFQESENEIILPDPEESSSSLPPIVPAISGEGTLFGFPASQQFDGHAEDMQRSSTPPPTLEMASHDTDLTSLADLHDSGHATIEAIGLVLEPNNQVLNRDMHELHEPPPPPPPMDDPLDPPPSIDSAFRTPETMGQRPTTPPLPPYLVPEHHHTHLDHGHHEEHEHVSGPPPYVD